MDLEAAIQTLTGSHPDLAAALLAVAAFLEYVFPPFPGDTVTLAGAVLVTGYGFPAGRVLAAVLLGSLAGAAVDFAVGIGVARAVARSRARGEGASAWTRIGIVRAAIRGTERASAAFARHGEAYIAVNRFLPGIRGFLFVAAGMAGMRFSRVMLWATVSAVAWNLLLMAVGMSLGTQLDRIEAVFRQYGAVAWTVTLAVALYFGVRAGRRRLRRRLSGDRKPPSEAV